VGLFGWSCTRACVFLRLDTNCCYAAVESAVPNGSLLPASDLRFPFDMTRKLKALHALPQDLIHATCGAPGSS